MRILYSIILILLCTIQALAQPKHEVRAVWLTTIGGIDWPHTYAQNERTIAKQQNELRLTLDKLQTAGINTVLLQTRVRGTVIYPSEMEPWDGCLSGIPGKTPGYDALQFAISECHRRGMELHAWVVTMPVGRWDGLGCKRLRQKMPNNIVKIKNEGFMNPESSQTASYLADICAEITRRYDIDGIHLDYIRYPEELPKLKTLSRERGRDNITRIVRAVSQRVKALKPWVKMSCSPIGKYNDTARYWSHGWNAYNTVCQDAASWLKEGLMDELFPMMYFRDNNFYPFALDWQERSNGRIVVPGLGIYFMSPRERDWPLTDITRELNFLRSVGLGHAYFRSKFFTDDTKGIYSFAKNEFSFTPALVPPMTWQSSTKPQAPRNLRATAGGNGSSSLSWTHGISDTTMIMFNIYASTQYPVDTEDGRNLVATRRQSRTLTVPQKAGLHYAVTAMDRYGNESEPIQEPAPSCTIYGQPATANVALIPCNGKELTIPEAAALSDAKLLIIETMQGTIVATRPYYRKAKSTSLAGIPHGMYSLRTLSKKGISHRLGYFQYI